MSKARNRYIRKKSNRQESRTAELFGGRTQIASGALDGLKGDVRTGQRSTGFNENDFLIENKFTDGTSYKLDYTTWEKIENEAIRDNFRIPIMQVDIQDQQLVILPEHLFKDIFDNRYFTINMNLVDIPGKSRAIRAGSFFDAYGSTLELNFQKYNTKLYVMNLSTFMSFLDEK